MKCQNCKTNEADYDVESNSYSLHCLACFYLFAAAPYCYNRDCSSKACGTRTVLVTTGPGVTTETARYACPNGCGTATAIGWATGSGRQSGRFDAQRKIDGDDMAWLVDVRLSDRGIASNYDAKHPVSRAYARAYVDTAKALLGATV